MKGKIKSLQITRRFGFIRATNGAEYFFHKDDFNGFWSDLDPNDRNIEVTFDIVASERGPRANNVRLIEGNE